jgi:hypothetical protein
VRTFTALLAGFIGLSTAALSARAGDSSQRPSIDAADIVRRSVERDWTDFEQQKNYTYLRQVDVYRYDGRGARNLSSSEAQEILILGSRPYEKLVAKDGRPISDKEAQRERQKLDRESASRKNESARERSKYEKQREEERRYIREIPEAFTFKLLGEESLNGQAAWVVQADPKPGYRPTLPDARLFTKVRAKVWIEKATYHWIKVDAEALEPLTFGFGLLRISSGGTFHFEQTRVNDEIWLPSQAVLKADARLALVKKLRTEIDVSFREYRKFQSDSKIVEVVEPSSLEPVSPSPNSRLAQ